eukprot:Lankesteria_metandrocarpae@DN4939_c0_g1_i3.p1
MSGTQRSSSASNNRVTGSTFNWPASVSPTSMTQGKMLSTMMPSTTSTTQMFAGQPSTTMLGGQTSTMLGQQQVTSERVMSSTIVSEHQINAPPENSVQYIEVPVIEEVIRHVPKKEIVEIQKRVPRYEYEWVERIVEVPQIQYVDKHVEVPQYQEVVKHVPVKQIVDVPREVVRYVPKIETKIVEQEVEVLGETIEVPKPYTVENKVVVPRFIDREVATVVAQRLHPVISESETVFVDCELKEYFPQLIPVDVYIPKPVGRNLIAAHKYEEHRVVDVPPAQFNALVKSLNVHMSEADSQAMYVKLSDGTIPMLHGAGSSIIPPLSSEWEKHHRKGQMHIVMVAGAVLPGQQHSGVVTTAKTVPHYQPTYMADSHHQLPLQQIQHVYQPQIQPKLMQGGSFTTAPTVLPAYA